MIPFGHIAGIPVEETLLSVAPIGAVGIGAVACAARGRLRRILGRRRRRPSGQ
jgi:hypothetical protein